jgi:hypothetical protein
MCTRQDKWSAVYSVSTVLLSLQSLLGEPNNASPLNNDAAALWGRDEGWLGMTVLRPTSDALIQSSRRRFSSISGWQKEVHRSSIVGRKKELYFSFNHVYAPQAPASERTRMMCVATPLPLGPSHPPRPTLLYSFVHCAGRLLLTPLHIHYDESQECTSASTTKLAGARQGPTSYASRAQTSSAFTPATDILPSDQRP